MTVSSSVHAGLNSYEQNYTFGRELNDVLFSTDIDVSDTYYLIVYIILEKKNKYPGTNLSALILLHVSHVCSKFIIRVGVVSTFICLQKYSQSPLKNDDAGWP